MLILLWKIRSALTPPRSTEVRLKRTTMRIVSRQTNVETFLSSITMTTTTRPRLTTTSATRAANGRRRKRRRSGTGRRSGPAKLPKKRDVAVKAKSLRTRRKLKSSTFRSVQFSYFLETKSCCILICLTLKNL